MKPDRQQILLVLLALIAVVRVGDWVLTSMIQEPLEQSRARTAQLRDEISKREKLLAEARNASGKIAAWTKQSLPTDPEVARSVYRNWLLALVRNNRLRSATVDSGSASTRRAKDNRILYRTLPFSVRCRGTLADFNAFLFQFSRAGHLHQISSMTLNPVATSGQFDVSLGIDTLLLSGRSGNELNTASSSLLISDNLRAYENIVKDNIFGIGINPTDPMKHTIVSAITFSNGTPQVWITEQLSDKTTQVNVGADFSTVALSGRVVEVHEHDVIIETSGEKMVFPIGKPFSEARPVVATP